MLGTVSVNLEYTQWGGVLHIIEEENKSAFVSGGHIVKKKYNTINSLFQNKNLKKIYAIFLIFSSFILRVDFTISSKKTAIRHK